MSSTEEQVKSVILKHKNNARKQQIARELNLGLEYIGFICRELERKGEITFSDGSYLLTTAKDILQQRIVPIKKNRKNKSGSRLSKQERDIQNTFAEFLGIPKMTEGLIEILERAGYKTIESLADAPIARLMQETKLELHEAAGLINQARKALNKI
ncbi:MAG: hypothetical protein NTV77_03570 [Candidatus Azambacteria bacterium]|nr:hypothetical protein [Candidatus Azambacteria bacterium]